MSHSSHTKTVCTCDHTCKVIVSALSERNYAFLLCMPFQGRVCVQGMSEQRILNGHEAFQLLLQGEGEWSAVCSSVLWIPVNVLSCTHITEARKFAATAMNDRSSRSHTIYRLTLESKEIGGDMVKVSVLVSLPMALLCIWWMLGSCHVSTIKPV